MRAWCCAVEAEDCGTVVCEHYTSEGTFDIIVRLVQLKGGGSAYLVPVLRALGREFLRGVVGMSWCRALNCVI